MRRLVFTTLALALACSRETPAPPAADTTPTTSTPATAPSVVTATSVPELQKGTYDEAMLWLRSAPKFDFAIDEGGIHAEGTMTRSTPGAEKVTFRAEGAEWSAQATAQGVSWKRGGKAADAPSWGSRFYQRVTLALDPQKKEGVPLLVSSEGASNLYRFTNANTGEVHEVWVRKSDSSIERMKIGTSAEIRFAP